MESVVELGAAPDIRFVGQMEHMLLGEIAHRSVNDFAAASAAIRGARHRAATLNLDVVLDRVSDRLDALGVIHRVLLPPCSTDRYDLCAKLTELCQAMVASRFSDREIRLTLQMDDVTTNSQLAWRLLMVVNELLVNVARHAYRNQSGLVLISLQARGPDLLLVVADDGEGWKEHAARLGYGSAVIGALTREMEASLSAVSSENGTTVEIRVVGALAAPA